MTPRRLAVAALMLSAGLCSGCTTFNDRFHVPGQDPLLTFLGYEYETSSREWPAAELPNLPAMRTELIPDRKIPTGTPHIGWPPL